MLAPMLAGLGNTEEADGLLRSGIADADDQSLPFLGCVSDKLSYPGPLLPATNAVGRTVPRMVGSY